MIWFYYLSARHNQKALPGKNYLKVKIFAQFLVLKCEYFFAGVIVCS